MRIFIAGVDGYLGWALAQHLTARGHEVAGADLFLRRKWVEEMGSWSATPISGIEDRLEGFRKRKGKNPPSGTEICESTASSKKYSKSFSLKPSCTWENVLPLRIP